MLLDRQGEGMNKIKTKVYMQVFICKLKTSLTALTSLCFLSLTMQQTLTKCMVPPDPSFNDSSKISSWSRKKIDSTL